ncbi:cob(I)yrinic acid a,c-diamide adenosyltransferase [Aeromonas schubertii]|uniref:cob(I)yrinic acid a,c-diamide adenosyltransferase n=1 Tax=Aeromonas TaxID=642 RepID=UPI0010A85ABF|nr:cob(I)yrinic acid a,c-diamide adenosyltransferase [Aeromonas schubertii]MBZ6071722.1 cob(I)yrinic acid a,c-diamide adenosyltransferase [Aeromonas schubertii]QCG48577.1 cob(I)yrinic acid a,c-diamide adenosyltransferase [Aeromonas schubertii]
MRIYTRQGDGGMTRLADGTVSAKTHMRVECYGLVDELNSHIGLLIALLPDEALHMQSTLQLLQHELFDLGAELALPGSAQNKDVWRVTHEWTFRLEQEMDRMSQDLSPLKQFILPGGSLVAAQAHVVRTLTRRCERQVVMLGEHERLNPALLPYLNRLSDWFFVLARWLIRCEGLREVIWQKESERK